MNITIFNDLISKGYSYTKIAKHLNMAPSTIKRQMKRLGLKTLFNPVQRVNIDVAELKILVNDHHSTYDIAEKLNTSQTNVRYWLKKCNLKTKSKYGGYKEHRYEKYGCYKYTDTYQGQQKRGLDRKILFVKQFGGKCSICGYNKNYGALTFHHKDPSEKEMGLDMRRMSNNSMVRLQAEIAKCQLLCHNCHSELHHPNLNIG